MHETNVTKKIEILSPAGSYEGLKAAINAGCDAVYVGGTKFGARAFADNLSEEELLQAIDYVHLHGKRIYLTVNTLLKKKEAEELCEYIRPFYEQGLDAAIVQDMGVIELLSRQFPKLSLHASTQMTLTDAPAINRLKEFGVTRVVLSRELSLEEIAGIRRDTDVEIETFVHGALCVCYSGQCLMSSMIGGRSGNRGRCAQPCRLPYSLWDGDKKLSDQEEPYLLSPKDICTLEILPELIEAGVDSFKIEGRMKRAEYTALTAYLYGKYRDLYLTLGREGYQNYLKAHDKDYQQDLLELKSLYNRGSSTTGYYQSYHGREMMSLNNPAYRALEDKERKTHLHEERKEEVSAYFQAQTGEKMTLTLEALGERVTISGDETEQAKNMPITSEKIEEQLRKTGNTVFIVKKLELKIQKDIFIPVGKLNELRRNAICALTDALLKKYRREAEKEPEMSKSVVPDPLRQEGESPLIASVSTLEQLSKVLLFQEIERVYLNSSVLAEEELEEAVDAIEKAGKKSYLILASVLRRLYREKASRLWMGAGWDKLSGFVVRNQEELSLLSDMAGSKEMVLDYNLYVYNEEAKMAFKRLGADRFTVPVELNFHELRQLDLSRSDMIIYGHQLLMTTVQCLAKETTGRCIGKQRVFTLKDRYQKNFYVIPCCRFCYNSIYNGQALSLLGYEREVKELAPYGLRLDFTIENAEETGRIVKEYIAVFCHSKNRSVKDGNHTTRGHLKRGVE